MIRGLYTSTFGMMMQQAHIDVVANNIANVDTPAFKMDRLAVREEPSQSIHRVDDHKLERIRLGVDIAPYIGELGTGVAAAERWTDHKQGMIIPTGNPLDVALEGEGFFMAETPDGIRFLRNGNFRINAEGEVVDSNGNQLLAVTANTNINPDTAVVMEGGMVGIQTTNIRLEPDANVRIGQDGVVFMGEDPLYRLVVVRFPEPTRLTKTGDNYYQWSGPDNVGTFARDTRLHQGSMEKSNVSSIEEMVKMITMYRNFESNQKIIQTQDEALGRAASQVGRLG